MKTIQFALIFTALISFTSACKKNYTCSCDNKFNGTVISTESKTINDTKKKAEDACKAQNTSGGVSGLMSEKSCSIK